MSAGISELRGCALNKQDNKILQIYFVFCIVVASIIGFVAVYILKMDLRDNETFKTLFIFCVISGVIIVLLAFYIFKKQGIDVYLPKTMLMLGLFPAASIGFVPIWLHPLLSWLLKIGLAIIAGALATANFYSVHYGGKRLRKQIGLETEEDRREKEREEKARKEKESKGTHE
ncbi:MAG: hypothetical protein C4526_06545 [Nitrospiraceae bacterium]|nr:MAG: hypothetical protein C4526_06545 [Nitrospiraceae bacterium]